jgi:hypothetical protein
MRRFKKRIQMEGNKCYGEYVSGNGPTIWDVTVAEDENGIWEITGTPTFIRHGESQTALENIRELEKKSDWSDI